MRRLYLSALSSLLAATALAQRPSTLAMTCDQAAGLVASQGAVVLSTGRHRFDRYVSSPGYCMLGEFAYDGWAPTRDTPQCRLGYTCEKDTPLFEDGFSIRGGGHSTR
jgi:hypothetical protein